MNPTIFEAVPRRLVKGDIEGWLVDEFRAEGSVAVDIETSGLDFRADRIGTVQLYAPGPGTTIVQTAPNEVPRRLRSLIGDSEIRKVFHHAPFDLRFLRAQWDVRAANVECTKIASKIVYRGLDTKDHSLQPLLKRAMGRTISKAQQRSDWTREVLSEEQLEYASADVEPLLGLIEVLRAKAADADLLDLLDRCFAHLPTRVELDVEHFGDVFAY